MSESTSIDVKQKDNFLLKKKYIDTFLKLKDEDAGKLIKGIFEYVCTGSYKLDYLLEIIFLPIKEDIDKNEVKYKKICERNKKNGSLGGRPKSEKQEEPRESQENPVGYSCKNTHISYTHISNNHISSNLEEIGYGEEEPLTTDEDSSLLEIVKEIIDYLNKKTSKNFLYKSQGTQKKIKARLKDGFKKEDFFHVIDIKCNEWLDNDEFNQYLRPETLFGTKFESYLNQPMPKLKKSVNGKCKEDTKKYLFDLIDQKDIDSAMKKRLKDLVDWNYVTDRINQEFIDKIKDGTCEKELEEQYEGEFDVEF